MSVKLRDPTLPAKAVVERCLDDSAVRNDGMRLRAASCNPWYALATCCGVQGDVFNPKLHSLNEMAWNSWVYHGLPASEQARFVEEYGFSEEKIISIQKIGINEVLGWFRKRLGEPNAQLPDVLSTCDFTKVSFLEPLYFQGFVFVTDADFSFADFGKDVNFRSVHFCMSANFSSVTFMGNANFRSATFFMDAKFPSATFSSTADFSSTAFKLNTNFSRAQFQTAVPKFYAAELFDDTKFTLLDDFTKSWPPLTGDDVMPATEQKRAYNRLRLFYNRTLQVDEEQFFHRQEMRCKAVDERWYYQVLYWLYENASDYGHSVWQPFYLLTCLWLFGTISKLDSVTNGYWPDLLSAPKAMGWSLANLFPFFGFHRLYFVVQSGDPPLHWILQLIGGAQTVFGFILLFLLGLGLRNRFRLR